MGGEAKIFWLPVLFVAVVIQSVSGCCFCVDMVAVMLRLCFYGKMGRQNTGSVSCLLEVGYICDLSNLVGVGLLLCVVRVSIPVLNQKACHACRHL